MDYLSGEEEATSGIFGLWQNWYKTTRWWIYFADLYFSIAIFINSLIVNWALEGWGVVDFSKVREFFGFASEWRESLFVVDWIAYTLNEVK